MKPTKIIALVAVAISITPFISSAQENQYILPQQCINANGDIVKEGSEVTLYKAIEDECPLQLRACEAGLFGGDAAYQHYQCSSIQKDKNNCERNGNIVPEFATIVAYKENSVSRDQKCSFVHKICVGGELVGPADFSETQCQFTNTYSENHYQDNSEYYDRLGNIKPETLLLPPLGKGDSCQTPRGETVPSGQTIISFDEQHGTLQGVNHYRISLCMNGTFDTEPTPHQTAIKKNPTSIASNSCEQQLSSLESQLDACLTNKQNMQQYVTNIIGDYEEQLKACDPSFVPTPLNFETMSSGLGQLDPNKEPCTRYGKEVVHGDSVVAYKKGSWIDEEFVCEEEIRTCIDGELSGDFPLEKCNHPGYGPHRCPTPLGAIEHGQTVTLYRDSYVTYPSECDALVRECNYGDLLGDDTFSQPTCKQGGEACNLPRGGTLNHGASITAFSRDFVPYGTDCEAYAKNRSCLNGVLSEGAEFKYSVCENNEPTSCPLPGGGVLKHGQTLTLYKYREVPGNVETQGEDICPRQSRTCDNGALETLEGTSAGFTFTFTNCEVVPPGSNISN